MVAAVSEADGRRAILLPLDRSTASEMAIPYAAALATALGCDLRLLHAIAPIIGGPNSRRSFLASAERYLSGQHEAVHGHHGIAPALVARFGVAAPTIVDEILRDHVALVVMATSRRRGLIRQMLGSVAEEVVNLAPIPVLLIPLDHVPPPDRVKRLLLPVDEAPLTLSVSGPVAELASTIGAEVVLVHVREAGARSEAWLPRVLARFTDLGVSTAWRAPRGAAAAEILRAAREERVDLIVLPMHGKSGLQRSGRGSVATAVLQATPIPVLTFGREALKRLLETGCRDRKTTRRRDEAAAQPSSR